MQRYKEKTKTNSSSWKNNRIPWLCGFFILTLQQTYIKKLPSNENSDPCNHPELEHHGKRPVAMFCDPLRWIQWHGPMVCHADCARPAGHDVVCHMERSEPLWRLSVRMFQVTGRWRDRHADRSHSGHDTWRGRESVVSGWRQSLSFRCKRMSVSRTAQGERAGTDSPVCQKRQWRHWSEPHTLFI